MSPVSVSLNGTVKHIIVTRTEVYQVETAEIPGFVSLNDYILPSADLSFVHPFDPLFFLLPDLIAVFLKQKKDKFREISDLAEELHCEELLNCGRLLREIEVICDRKNAGDNAYYRLDPIRLRSWLMRKYESLASDINSSVPSLTGETEISLPAKVSALCIMKDLLPQTLFSDMMDWAQVAPEAMERICNPSLKRAADTPLHPTPQKLAKPSKAKSTAPPKGMQAITGFFKPKN